MEDVLNLIVTGVGGQGNVLASRLIVNAIMAEDLKATNSEVYGPSQRGGSVASHIRISKTRDYGPLIPEGSADIILGFEPVEVLKTLRKFGNPKVKIILDPHPSSITSIGGRVMDYPEVDEIIKFCNSHSEEAKVVEATELAEELGAPVVHNMVMVGCLVGSGWIPISKKTFEHAISETFSEEKVEINLKALEKGIEAIDKK